MEDNIASDTNNILEIRYCQSHHLIKDNIENKQMDKIEKLCNGIIRLRPSYDIVRLPIQLHDHSITSPSTPLENHIYIG